MIRSEPRYLIGAKVAGTVKWNHGQGKTWPKNRGFMSGLGNNPTKTRQVGFLAGSGTELNRNAGQNPDLLLTLSRILWATSPVLQTTSKYSQTPLELRKVLLHSARAFSGVPESTCSYGGGFRVPQDLTYRIVTFWGS